jgi:hypothetical protein
MTALARTAVRLRLPAAVLLAVACVGGFMGGATVAARVTAPAGGSTATSPGQKASGHGAESPSTYTTLAAGTRTNALATFLASARTTASTTATYNYDHDAPNARSALTRAPRASARAYARTPTTAAKESEGPPRAEFVAAKGGSRVTGDAKGFIGPGGHRNIPSDWVTKPSSGGRGQRYWDPSNPRGNYVRIEEDSINGRHVHVTSGGKKVLYNGDKHIPFNVWDKWSSFGGP